MNKIKLFSPERCLIIAEVAQSHDGSLGSAHAFIDAVAGSGADVIKFQTHIATAESTRREKWRVKFSRQDRTRYDYWKRMEFTEEQWGGLKRHATTAGLKFISSPFSQEAVRLLSRVGTCAWKIASGEVQNTPMLEAMAASRLPFILSTGMSSMAEIDSAVAIIRRLKRPLAVLQCSSEYPCTPEGVGLNMLQTFASRYKCPVGLSDHSGSIFPGLAAAALGASIIEVHVTFSRDMFGPDVSSSVTVEELKQLVAGVRFIERMRNNPVDKDAAARKKSSMRRLFGKSIVASMDLPAGMVLSMDNLSLKKPGDGLGPTFLSKVLGKKLRRSLRRDERLKRTDI